MKEQNTYNQFADRYAHDYIQPDAERRQFNFNRDVVIPPLLDLVGDVAGLSVLDAGCGEGVVSRLLAERGAQVVGVDVVPRFIGLAQERDKTGSIRYLCHDLSQPLPAYQGHFDLVVREKVDSYFDSGVATLYAGLARNGIGVYHHHRTMQEYVTAFAENGMLLHHLIDVQVPTGLVGELNPYHQVFPVMLILELIKQG